MADNFSFKDGGGAVKSRKSRDDGAGNQIGLDALLGDDSNVLLGSKSDTAWDMIAGSPTWTAVFKAFCVKLVDVETAVEAVTGAVTEVTSGLATEASLSAIQGSATPGVAASKSVALGGVYRSSPISLSDGQQATAAFTALGNMKVAIAEGGSVAQDSTTSGQSGSLIMAAAQATPGTATDGHTLPLSMTLDKRARVETCGIDAAGAALTARPLVGGGRAGSTLPAAVDDGDAVHPWYDVRGRTIVNFVPREMRGDAKITITNDNTAKDLIAAGGVGVLNDVYKLNLVNTSNTDVIVDLIDDATVRDTFLVKAMDQGGMQGVPGTGLKQAVAAKKWKLQCRTAVTSLEATVYYVGNAG